MIYQCSPKGHRFLWAAVVTEHVTKNVHFEQKASDLLSSVVLADWFEVVSHRCPVEGCGSIEISEYTEPKRKLVSQVEVPRADVDKYLKIGYEEIATYVNKTVLGLYEQAEVKKQ